MSAGIVGGVMSLAQSDSREKGEREFVYACTNVYSQSVARKGKHTQHNTPEQLQKTTAC